VVEHLPSKHKVPSSNPSTAKKEEKEERERKRKEGMKEGTKEGRSRVRKFDLSGKLFQTMQHHKPRLS
jgi:hypothetical protein